LRVWRSESDDGVTAAGGCELGGCGVFLDLDDVRRESDDGAIAAGGYELLDVASF
jgi:hypothetical protein